MYKNQIIEIKKLNLLTLYPKIILIYSNIILTYTYTQITETTTEEKPETDEAATDAEKPSDGKSEIYLFIFYRFNSI